MEKDDSDRPSNVKKILLDPERGFIIDENKSGDMYPPTFPSGRRKREVGDSADPNGHSHGAGGDQMDIFKSKRRIPKKTVQYQSSGTSTDYDLDYVQEEKEDGDSNDGGYEPTGENGDEEKEQEGNVFEPTGENENDQQTRSYEPTGENGVQTKRRRRRRVKIAFKQKAGKDGGAILPDGAKETISAGGGRSPGHHEGGGITVKVC